MLAGEVEVWLCEGVGGAGMEVWVLQRNKKEIVFITNSLLWKEYREWNTHSADSISPGCANSGNVFLINALRSSSNFGLSNSGSSDLARTLKRVAIPGRNQ